MTRTSESLHNKISMPDKVCNKAKPAPLLEVFSDGGYLSRVKVGGWGAVLIKNNQQVDTDLGACKASSSLEMELLAAVNALELVESSLKTNKNIVLHTDSKILIEGLEGKIALYQQQNWHHPSGRAVEFRGLWERFLQLTQRLNVTVKWVKGHNGNIGNQLADKLARQAIDRYLIDQQK